MNGLAKAVASALVAAAMLLGITAGTASADQAAPPYSSVCQASGGSFFSDTGGNFHCVRAIPPLFSDKQVTKIKRTCTQLGGQPLRVITVGISDDVQCLFL